MITPRTAVLSFFFFQKEKRKVPKKKRKRSGAVAGLRHREQDTRAIMKKEPKSQA